MLHLIPAPLHRQLYRVAYHLRGWVRMIARLPSRGVSVIALDDEGRVLLVRHSYGSGGWALPGGGLGRREEPSTCARREIREELGCRIVEMHQFEVVKRRIQGGLNRSHIYVVRLRGEPTPDEREVVAAQWFAPDRLPEDMVWLARTQLERFFGDQNSGS
jgi:ADP-ribose pyrophosphatase YjhB (NUDIX family)